MKRDEIRKVAREAFDQLVKDVEAGKSDTLKAYLKAMGKFHRYSVGNAILIQLQRPDDSDEDENADDETVTTFKTAYVFDISQTDGRALPEFARANGDPGDYMEGLERFIADRGIKLERSESLRMAEGVSIGGTILFKACLAPAEEFSVLVHELSHEILHLDPANRPKEKTVREAEAEAVAYVVCQGIGLDVNTASSDYCVLTS